MILIFHLGNFRAANIFLFGELLFVFKHWKLRERRMVRKSKRLRSNGKSSWSKLDHDMVFEIFKRLENSTLADCELVSKSWHNLIRSPDFVEFQFSNHLSEKKLEYIIFPFLDCNMVLVRLPIKGGDFEQVSFPDLDELCLFMICSYNGLIFCINDVFTGSDIVKTDVYVMNPATGDTFLLPECGPSDVEPAYGVAFGPKFHEYKVFRFYEPVIKSNEKSAEKLKVCEVYSSSIGLWRNIGIVPQCPKGPMESTHIFISDKVYWFISSNGNSSIPSSILYVDSEEFFQTIRFPDQATVYSFLVDIKGQLGVLIIYPDKGYSFDIWVLQSCNESIWEKRCSSIIEVKYHGRHINSVAALENQVFFIIEGKFRIFNMIDGSWSKVSRDDSGVPNEYVFKHIASRAPCNGVYEPPYIQ